MLKCSGTPKSSAIELRRELRDVRRSSREALEVEKEERAELHEAEVTQRVLTDTRGDREEKVGV